MYDPNCVRCVQARNAGYNGCRAHNVTQARYTAPVVVEHVHRAPTVIVVDDDDAPGTLGWDTSGHPTENLGGGLGVDLVNGDVTIGGIDTGIEW